MSKFQQYTAGFLIGTLAGGLVVLLSTPLSGKELRQKLSQTRRRLQSSSHQLKREVTSLKDNLMLLQSEGKDALKSVGSDLKNAFTLWKEETDPAITSLKSDIEALKKKAEQAAKEMKKNKTRATSS